MTIADRLARPELLQLAAYQSAHWDPRYIRLHANENPWRAVGDESVEGLARYPEPVPSAVEACLAGLYEVPRESLLATRGADEGIDLLARAVLRAGVDAALVCTPTFGMYAVSARIQGADVIDVPLRAGPDFGLDRLAVLRALEDPRIRLLYLCAPGNPTGRDLATEDLVAVLEACRERALVVIDEAYVEFAGRPSWTTRLADYPHLVVLRTLSKAYSLAGARVGSVIADASIIALLRKLIPPYSMSTGTIESVCRALSPAALVIAKARIARLIAERAWLAERLSALPSVASVGPSAANFLLVTLRDPIGFCARAERGGFLLRDYTRHPQTPNAVRISVADRSNHHRLLKALTAP